MLTDLCSNDADKTVAGQCGCGELETDTDSDVALLTATNIHYDNARNQTAVRRGIYHTRVSFRWLAHRRRLRIRIMLPHDAPGTGYTMDPSSSTRMG